MAGDCRDAAAGAPRHDTENRDDRSDQIAEAVHVVLRSLGRDARDPEPDASGGPGQDGPPRWTDKPGAEAHEDEAEPDHHFQIRRVVTRT
jgi:hypothetical protein